MGSVHQKMESQARESSHPGWLRAWTLEPFPKSSPFSSPETGVLVRETKDRIH
jgi:hypothetical protein